MAKVSVIIATYNRPHVLKLALQSLLDQDHKDWEGLVIGDACSDETASVVAGFDDSRLRYENLAENCGEQSGPNNRGLALATGPYVAYLNHDDLWWPDHLSSSLAFLEQRKNSKTFGLLNEFRLGDACPGLLIVPPCVWHGVHNTSGDEASLVNFVDHAYSYEDPDHWRLAADSPEIPYRFSTHLRATS